MKGKKNLIAVGMILIFLLSGCGGSKRLEGLAKVIDDKTGAGFVLGMKVGLEWNVLNPETDINPEKNSSDPGSGAGTKIDVSDPGTDINPEENTSNPGTGTEPKADTPEPGAGSSQDPPSNTEKKVSSMEKLLKTSILPVGTTMYIWGGGWNEEDTGSGIESITIGLSPRWAEFAALQTAVYDHNATRYQIHDGLDCSGYIGWLIYNTFHTKSGGTGYVGKAYQMAETFASYGWGDYLPAGTAVGDWKAGDICSMKGHVWMCLGACGDGSVLLIHSSPPGVRICGTRLKDGGHSQAIALAEKCMSTCYPDWYSRYPDCAVNSSYLVSSSRMRWNSSTLWDAGSYQAMSAQEIAEFLFVIGY